MLNLEFNVKTDSSESYVLWNGHKIENSWAFENTDGIIHAGVRNKDAANEIISSFTFEELSSYVGSLSFPFTADWCEHFYSAIIELHDSSTPYLVFEVMLDFEEWANSWSIADFARQLNASATARSIPGVSYHQDDEESVVNGFGIKFEVANALALIKDEFLRFQPLLRSIVEDTLNELHSRAAKNSLVTLFQFPSEIASACEQYLVYFAQFLADLGIDADVNLNHDAHNVLFSVTPKDTSEALETIKAALDAYLQLPNDRNFRNELMNATDMAAFQLRANISHLESQVTLGLALTQAKDATIKAQEETIKALRLSNFRLQQIAEYELQQNKTQTLPALTDQKKKDSETVIDGVLSVRDVEIKGFVLHTPELIRKLKRRLQRK